MKSESNETTNSTFVKHVMKKIRAISEHTANGDFGLVEQYYQDMGHITALRSG